MRRTDTAVFGAVLGLERYRPGMATWVLGVAALSIAATAGLAWVLMRVNASALERHQRGEGGGGAAAARHDDAGADAGGDGGGD